MTGVRNGTEKNRSEYTPLQKSRDGGVKPPLQNGLSSGFGAEDTLEARAGELDTDELFSSGLGIADVDDAALGGEV